MKYEMFLYKPKTHDKDSFIVNDINRAISKNSKADWEDNCADRGMLHCESAGIKDEILSKLTMGGNQLCKIDIRYSPQNRMEYLYIVTSYEKAKCVLKELSVIALEHELALYDAETDRTFLTEDIYCESYVTMRLRTQQLNYLILKTQKPIWRLRKLDITNGKYIKSSTYVLTLAKDVNSFEDRIRCFYDLLKSSLSEGEELVTESKCFIVHSNEYEITYCVEGYKKNADKIGYIENGQAVASLIRRMPCEIAIKQCGSLTQQEVCDINDRMRFIDWINKYPNPAERFVASVNLAKQLRKEKMI